MNRLYVSDLDGTLLRNDATLSSFSRDTLQRLLADGLYFSVASARSVVSMQSILKELPIALPVVEFNGAFISDLQTGQHLITNAIEATVVEDLYGLLSGHGQAPFVSTFDGKADCLYYSDLTNGGMTWYLQDRLDRKDQRLRRVHRIADAFQDQVVCITVIGSQHGLMELQGLILARHAGSVSLHLFENRYSPGWHWLTIHDRRATKDQGVRALVEASGLDNCELVVFGDDENDVSLFGVADHAVAVANAAKSVRSAAAVCIGSNQDDSVAAYIKADRERWLSAREAECSGDAPGALC